MVSEPSPTTDGRRLRREHGRLAVIDAVIDLMLDLAEPPTAEQIAGRAGVSIASVHRYFTSLDQLRQLGVQRYLERIDHLLQIDSIGDGPLPHRIARLVSSRLAFYEATAGIARYVRRQAADVDDLRTTLHRLRGTLAGQVEQQFTSELTALTPAVRSDRVAVLATLTSFESWDQLTEQGLDRTDIERAWCTNLTLLLTPAGPR